MTVAEQTIISSLMAPVDIPDTDIATFFFDKLRTHSELADSTAPRPVFIDGSTDEQLTLVEIESLSTKLASGLYHAKGIRRGDVVAIMLPNSHLYLPIILSVLVLGASCTLANPAFTARELAFQLKDSCAKCIIAMAAFNGVVREAIEGLEEEVQVLFTDTPEPLKVSVEESCESIFDILTDLKPPVEPIDPSTTALIPYSSGTTGHPKGVILTHRNIIANILQAMAQMPLTNRGTTVAVLPMYHIYGLTFLCLIMPCRGLTTVTMHKFSMPEFLQLVERHQVEEALLVPPIVNMLAKMSNIDHDLSSLRSVLVGAAPLSKDTISVVEQRLPHMRVFQGYGLSETSPAISLNRYEDRVVESSGQLLPNIDAKVTSDSGDLKIGEIGELCFRGPNIMAGYLNNPEETQRSIDQDGFFHTGDIGYIDSHRHVYLTDRKKELIKFNGFQVAPAELEGVLLQHPLVRDCAVVGVFDQKRQTEVPRAFVVLNNNDSEDVGCIVEWANAQLAYYKHLRGGCVVVDAIPKSPSGKILRRVLKEKTQQS
ncbi:hypothetical protein GGI25_004681 [Coemansia spiralis]|uniref:Uncharacterized protein n=2 Tax=Coemansia TaxID=4863 RepID=A0A9W8KX68_9FUNG|nr:hypothetical protein EDC05_005546 [Coemansia umbellata]KAJ2620559.1 hypothetical protein GGI26_004901 [Coemansia sp. RSA 1358]KAJ2673580.1 hypothetical protein GGI25_004681 [Coemansia spiralis]